MKKTLVLVLLLWFCASALIAQGAAASTNSADSGDAVVPVTLGQSVVTLTGPWKFHVGDNPRWADPNFDDSQWETVDLTPTPQTTLPGVPIPGFVAGWTSRGHPGYAGFAWYRMRVRVSGASGPLNLLSPEWFDDGFQVFVNGRLAGSSGDFNRHIPVPDYGNPAMFTMPVAVYQPGPEASTLIALRFYMTADSFQRGGTGGMHAPPRIGLPDAASAILHMEWDRVYRRTASALAAAMLYFIFALLIAMMFAFTRKDKVLLWPLSACIFVVIHVALVFSTSAQWMSAVHMEVLIVFADKISWGLWALTWWAYFGLQRRKWLLNAIIVLGIVEVIYAEVFTIALWTAKISNGLLSAKSVSDFIVSHAELIVIAAIAWLGWKRVEMGRWPLYLALFFYAIPGFIPEMTLLHLRTAWLPFGILIPLGLITACASLFFFSIVLFQQFRASLKRQQETEEDVKQAQEIQQLLIPEQLPQLPGWAIESEYRPAREVGGDFFQIIPHPSDGSLLVVAGDVAGKGLQAGMLVALIVGAIRTESVHTLDPESILNALNARLHGREHAQATCLALRIEADGSATLANAGHLAPYLNGHPLEMEGALPLGMMEDAEFSVLRFTLQERDRLVMMSDGVVEARSTKGDLLGFERMAALTREAAADIAQAAQRWGQEDDITVLSITRTRTMEAATA